MNIEPQQNSEDCPICKGILSIEVKVPGGYRIDPCRCAVVVKAQQNLIRSYIPRKYQDWDLRNLQKSFKRKNDEAILTIKKYAEELPKNIRASNGLWISAPSGLNKNAFMCYVLKEALEKNYKAYYAKATTLTSKKLDGWKDAEAKWYVRQFVEYSSIVAIADIEKINPNNNPNDFKVFNFYEIIADLDDNRAAMLVSSNMPKGNVLKKMPMFMRERLRPLKEIVLRYPSNIDNDEDEDY
jgi:hypothetical protein